MKRSDRRALSAARYEVARLWRNARLLPKGIGQYCGCIDDSAWSAGALLWRGRDGAKVWENRQRGGWVDARAQYWRTEEMLSHPMQNAFDAKRWRWDRLESLAELRQRCGGHICGPMDSVRIRDGIWA